MAVCSVRHIILNSCRLAYGKGPSGVQEKVIVDRVVQALSGSNSDEGKHGKE